MNQINVLRAAVVAGLSFVTTGRVIQDHYALQVASRPYGRYTLDQILQRSLPLCSALTSGGETLCLSGSRLIRRNMERAIPVWAVDGVQARGDFNIHLMWDAETGELMFASLPQTVASQRAGRLLSREEAQRITSSWLTTLGMSVQTTGWRPTSSTQNGTIWEVEWWAGVRGAALTIDSCTGELIMATTMKPASEAARCRIWAGEQMAALLRKRP